MKKIRIIVDDISAVAELSGSKTSEAIWDALPIENTVNTWGEEIYFEIPVKSALDENAKEVVEKVTWVTGRQEGHSAYSLAQHPPARVMRYGPQAQSI